MVEPLTTRIEGITMLSFVKLKFVFSSDLKRSEAAVLPISKAGWVMVVSEGLRMDGRFKVGEAN